MASAPGLEQFAEHWQRVGKLLEQSRREELRALTDDRAAGTFQSLASFIDQLPARPPRTTSGFVEQQRLFLMLSGL